MPFCTHCGNRIPDDANFCPSCGRQVSSVQRSTAVYNPQKEIREAVHAGERALDSLYAAQAELNKAMTWDSDIALYTLYDICQRRILGLLRNAGKAGRTGHRGLLWSG